MNNAIIFLKNNEEKQLARAPYLGGTLLVHVIKQLKKTGLIKNVFLVGTELDVPGTIRRQSIRSVIAEIGNEGKTILTSVLYPEIDYEDYTRLLEENVASAVVYNGDICRAFMIPNVDLGNYENLNFKEFEIKDKKIKMYTMEDARLSRQQRLDDVIIFPLTKSKELVDEVCNYLNVKPGQIKVEHFADGETLVELGESVRGKQIYVIQSTSKPVNDSLMEVLICLDALRRSSAGEITCIIPYFGYARQDRKALPRQPITAKLVAAMLEEAGANRVVTFDLHAAQIQGFFHCPVDDLTTVPMMGQYFRRKGYLPQELVVVSPDHGGVKRARNLAEMLECPLAIIDKRRPRANVAEACNIVGEVANKIAIIVDDIIDTGGSLMAAANILIERGAKEIYVCVAHGIFSHDAIAKIEASQIKEVAVTNTITIPQEELALSTKIKVQSIGWMLSKLILAVSCHTPVSDVYALYEDK